MKHQNNWEFRHLLTNLTHRSMCHDYDACYQSRNNWQQRNSGYHQKWTNIFLPWNIFVPSWRLFGKQESNKGKLKSSYHLLQRHLVNISSQKSITVTVNFFLFGHSTIKRETLTISSQESVTLAVTFILFGHPTIKTEVLLFQIWTE